jgi:hypothetical protein
MTAEAIQFGSAALVGRRCNPYGAESGGPKRILGGLHGPASARVDTDEVPGLPQSVIEGEWTCPNLAQVTVRMVCEHGHRGQRMELCSWHEEPYFHSEMVAGKLRRVKAVRQVRGHYEEIGRRQAGACPRCLFPGRFAELYKAQFAWQQELAYITEAGGPQAWYSDRAEYIRSKIEDITVEFDAGNRSGEIHRCPLKLTAVS